MKTIKVKSQYELVSYNTYKSRMRPVRLELDAQTQTLTVKVDMHEQNSSSRREYNSVLQTFRLPGPITAEQANRLMKSNEVQTLCECILDGFRGTNEHGVARYTSEAREAIDTLKQLCSYYREKLVNWYLAEEWFESTTPSELNLTAHTTEKQLLDIVEVEEQRAEENGCYLIGTQAHLEDMLKKLLKKSA